MVLSAAALSLACGVGSFVTYKMMRGDIEKLKNEHATELRKMQDAGAEVVRKRDAATKPILEKYRADLLAANSRKPRSVYRDPPDCLSETASGTDGPGAPVSDRRDYGFELRAARDALIRCNALIEVSK
jgi:hypothetical protein